LREEGEQRSQVVRRRKPRVTVIGASSLVAGASRRRPFPRPPQAGRIHPVAAGECRAEAAQALEAARQRHLRDRHLRIGEELLGE
jgi:hypothetical protein